MPGLFENEIYNFMKKYPNFIGVIARDEINLVKPYLDKYKYIGFVLNLDKAKQSGSHWTSVLIDYRPNGSQSVEYYDSFGKKCPEDIKWSLKSLIGKDLILKFKQNLIKKQSYHTHNCGYFAMEFLKRRFKGKSFIEATEANEKDIRKLPIFKLL